jgi:glycosyltransferase involved in cell wall biosynthesis
LSNQVFKAKKRIFSNAGGRLQFVTPSTWLKNQADKSGIVKELIDIGGAVAMPEIKVIPNPIDTDYFKPRVLNSVKGPIRAANLEKSAEILENVEKDEAGDGLSISSSANPFVLMFAAANLGNPAKGFAEFRSVCNGLVDLGFANVEALLVGENRLPNGDLGLKCAVKELGFISDAKQMRDAYWQADVYVTTSHEENLPTTIMESLSCGVPVAAFAVGGIPEMISQGGDHQTGWLSEKMDVESLIQGIAAYIEMEPSKRIKMQEASRSAAVANYGSVSIAKRYLSLYRK